MPPLILHHLHPWDVSPKEAIVIQKHLQGLVRTDNDVPSNIRRIAGVDVGFEEGGRVTRAAIAVLEYPSLVLTESRIARLPTKFPYIPGLLSFREIPALIQTLEALRKMPDLILVDGQGYAHPRRLGIACHLGVLTNIPTIGVGKTRLVGTHGEVPDTRFGWVPLFDGDEVIGAVMRTRLVTRPVYISVGHRVDLPTALQWVRRMTGRYRLPEAIRWAHRLASAPQGSF